MRLERHTAQEFGGVVALSLQIDAAAVLRGRMLAALEGVSGGRVMRAPFTALGLSVLATSLATSALAADLPVKAPPVPAVQAVSWTGLYVGGHAGYAWGR